MPFLAVPRPAAGATHVTPKMQAKRFVVTGMVQGVGYRYFARRAAEQLGLAGYVRNQRDGGVEVYAIGSDEQLRLLRAELARGPRMASVSAVREEEAPFEPRFARGFSIEFEA